MTELKQLNGTIDIDNPNEVAILGCHKDALNIIFEGNGNNIQAQSIVGNRQVPFTLPAGTNVCIGRHYDAINNRVFYFNANSNGEHGIYILNVISRTIQTLLKTNLSQPDPLGFDANYPISSIDIIYNDDVDGDILNFLDSLGRPTQINIQKYLTNPYNPVKRAYIDVAKAPPLMPIKCVYENDFNVTVNNVSKSLFQFVYRFVYDNLEKSVWSTGSIPALPYEPFDPLTKNNRFYNARIALFMQTGGADVLKIEVAFRQSTDGVISDYFLIDTFVKSDLNIADNDIFMFRFYNDGQYSEIDMKEQVLPFDYVPHKAGAAALLNGNVRAYSDITEGYDKVVSNITTQSVATTTMWNLNGVLFFAQQGGDDALGEGNNITLYVTGVGDNDISTGNPLSLYNANASVTLGVKAIDAANANKSFQFSFNSPTSIGITAVLGGLQNAALLLGYNVVAVTSNSITLGLAGVKLLTSTLTCNRDTGTANKANAANYAQQFNSTYALGIYYRDEKGRGYTVTTNIGCDVDTINAQTNQDAIIPAIIANIRHRAPIWAVDYQFVLSTNRSYDKQLNWVSKQTFADTPTVNASRYAYIDVSNIADYNEGLSSAANAPTQGVVSYDFATGDRIRFLRRYPSASPSISLSPLQYDYEILGVLFTANVNGTIQNGTFLKILYPTSDIGANFDFTGADFQNYQLFIYNYAKRTSESSTVYYEIGHRRKIGNAGTVNAYHIANNQTQSSDLVTFAQEYITIGDMFARFRTVPIVTKYNLKVNETGQNTATALNIVVPNSPITTSTHTLKTQNYAAYAPALSIATNGLYLNTTTNNQQIRLKGTMPIINNSEDCTFDLNISSMNTTGTLVVVDTLIVRGTVSRSIVKNFDFDFTLNLTYPQNRVQIWIAPVTSVSFNAIVVKAFDLQVYIIDRNISIPIIETSFSDVQKIELTPYSRPTLVDADAKQERKKTLFRFSQPREQGSNINLSNRFYPNNIDEFNRQYGATVRMVLNEQFLYIMQERKNGIVGVYQKFIKDQNGSSNLITTDTIITPNSINYDEADFGISNQPLAICTNNNIKYFADVTRGAIVRRATNGSLPISELYNIQKWAGDKLVQYLTDTPYQYGGKAKVIACYNTLPDRHGEVLFVLQAGNGRTGYTIAFDDTRNGFSSFYSYVPDHLVCAGNLLVSWHNGNVFTHDNVAAYNNFYGVQYTSFIKLVFNQSALLKKMFHSIGYQANNAWLSENIGDVNTQYINSQTQLRQVSNLVQDDYEEVEGRWDASFMRDANSRDTPDEGINNGDYLQGTWLEIKLSNTLSAAKQFLYGIYVNFTKSNRT